MREEIEGVWEFGGRVDGVKSIAISGHFPDNSKMCVCV